MVVVSCFSVHSDVKFAEQFLADCAMRVLPEWSSSCRLAEVIADEGRACVIVINKWDTVPNKTSNTHVTFKDEVLAQLRGLSWATVLFTSASTGALLADLLDIKQMSDICLHMTDLKSKSDSDLIVLPGIG